MLFDKSKQKGEMVNFNMPILRRKIEMKIMVFVYR